LVPFDILISHKEVITTAGIREESRKAANAGVKPNRGKIVNMKELPHISQQKKKVVVLDSLFPILL
jgi:hypothetical protein